jgi:hypothetical protein
MADETSKTAIYGNVKIQSDHAARLRREAAARKLFFPITINPRLDKTAIRSKTSPQPTGITNHTGASP